MQLAEPLSCTAVVVETQITDFQPIFTGFKLLTPLGVLSTYLYVQLLNDLLSGIVFADRGFQLCRIMHHLFSEILVFPFELSQSLFMLLSH